LLNCIPQCTFQHEVRLCINLYTKLSCFVCSQVDNDATESVVFLVTEKRERDVLGQIVVPLSNVDDCCSTQPLRVPLQPGLRCPDLVRSPGELIYDVWTTTADFTATPEDRSLTSRTSASFSRLRRKLNSSPIVSSSSRWNDFKTNRRHSLDALLDLHTDTNSNIGHISFEEDGSSATIGEGFMSSDGYVKRSSLSTVSEDYFQRPQILEVCPSKGPTTGGTVVTVRGRDLGLSRDDVVGLYICCSDVVDSVQYISSERLVCTTAAWRPCVGCVSVETASGGIISSAVQFTFTAVSEPAVSFTQHDSYTLSKNKCRRFSVDMLEDIKLSYLHDGKRQTTQQEQDVLRRQKRLQESTAACCEQHGPPIVEIHPMKTSDVTCSPTTTSQINHLHDEKAKVR